MSGPTRPSSGWQRHPAVRLRREVWGGIAFHRATGDLLELDDEGFAVLMMLGTVHSVPGLLAALSPAAAPPRLAELASFLHHLEREKMVRRVELTAPPLPPGPAVDRRLPAHGNGLSAPLVAHWAVTYRCNLHCPFCYSESGPHRDAGPGAEVRRRLVERLAAWGVLEVALGGGEPTILPDFPGLLAAVRTAGMVPNVTTNGTAQHPAVVAALAEHAGVVHLSADRPDLLDQARGQGVFDRLRGTARLLRAAGVPLGVNLLLTPDNIRDVRRSLEALLDLGVRGVTFLRPKGEWAARHWPGFPAAADMARLAGDLRGFLRTPPPLRLYVDTALRGEWTEAGLLDDPEPEVTGCGGGQRHVAVTPEGDVYPCSHVRLTRYRMGNLLTDELGQLWGTGAGRNGRLCYVRDCEGTRCPCRGRHDPAGV
jgi:MoaA/NifB/PqqE/SkfB family radical SAM enzyme